MGTNLPTLRSRRFRRTRSSAMDTPMGRFTAISFKLEATASEQSTGNRGKTFLSLVIIVSLLFPGLSLAASQNAAIDGAKKEGKFVLYTAMQPEDSTKLIELYRSRFPFVDASFFRAGSAPLLNRILTESRAGRSLFDAVSGKVSDLLLLQKRGLLGTMSSSELAAYPDKFKDKQSRWVDIYNNYYTIAYNSQRVRPSEVPTAWEGLLDPRWRDGKITLDPRSYDWYFGMLTAWGGQRGGDFMRKLNQQKPAFRDGNVLIANLLAAGEFPIAITYAHLVERLRTRGAPVDWVSLKPMVAAPISIALAARPMNPNAANLFVDLVLSKEGSEILKSMGRVPTRGDVLPSAKRLDAKDLDLFSLHVSSDEMDPEDFRKSFGLR
ncbi:MAG: ABC transporter substrate-binding protein [Candidatus Binatia bacterium]